MSAKATIAPHFIAFRNLDRVNAEFNSNQIVFLNPYGEYGTEIEFSNDSILFVEGKPETVRYMIEHKSNVLVEIPGPEDEDDVPPCTPCPDSLR